MIEIECLDAIPAAVDEEEEMAVEEVLAEALLDEAREAVERGIFLIPLAARTVRTVHLRPSPSSILSIRSAAAPSVLPSGTGPLVSPDPSRSSIATASSSASRPPRPTPLIAPPPPHGPESRPLPSGRSSAFWPTGGSHAQSRLAPSGSESRKRSGDPSAKPS